MEMLSFFSFQCGGSPCLPFSQGWFERVYAYGLACGVGQHEGTRWGDRYGEGKFIGATSHAFNHGWGRLPHYTERGVNGAMEDLLFPIQHGMLWFPGMDVLPPLLFIKPIVSLQNSTMSLLTISTTP